MYTDKKHTYQEESITILNIQGTTWAFQKLMNLFCFKINSLKE